jgi:hypothetical protein
MSFEFRLTPVAGAPSFRPVLAEGWERIIARANALTVLVPPAEAGSPFSCPSLPSSHVLGYQLFRPSGFALILRFEFTSIDLKLET